MRLSLDVAVVPAAQGYRTSRRGDGVADDHALDLRGALEEDEVVRCLGLSGKQTDDRVADRTIGR